MATSVTLVSCLFWLARTKWKHSGFPPNYDRYTSWSENFLSLDANIVIFTDDHYIDVVKERRAKYDPDFSKTVIIKKSLKDLEFYQKYFFKMSVLMSSPHFKRVRHAECADNMYPLYNVVQYNKISLIKEVRDLNPFNATHLMWMDCGSCRENLEKYRHKKFPTNPEYLNDKVIHFTHNMEFNLGGRKQDYFLSQIRNIQGTSWVMPVQHVDKYHELISKELVDTMNDGYIGSDEKTYDSIYQNNKDIVQLVKCGWFQFFDVMSVAQESPVTEEPADHCPAENVDTCEPAPVQEVQPVEEAGPAVEEEQPVCNEEVMHICSTPEVALQAQSAEVSVPKTWWRRIIGV